MSLSPVLTFDDPAKVPAIVKLYGGLKRSDVRKIMGRAIATDLRKYFTKLDRERTNKLGGDRTHFYGQARRGVQQPELVGGDGVKVSINQVGIAQRYFGGEIKPRTSKFLTIPVSPEAYGHRAREFSDLVAVFFEDGSGVLERPDSGSESGIGEIYYRLVRSVYQEPDPTVLPPEEELQESALGAASEFIEETIA